MNKPSLKVRCWNQNPRPYNKMGYLAVISRAVIIFTRYSTTSFIDPFIFLEENQSLISSILMLPSVCAVLYCILDAQLSVQPQFVSQRTHCVCIIFSMLNCFFSLILYLTENIHCVLLHVRCSTLSPGSARTLQGTRMWFT